MKKLFPATIFVTLFLFVANAFATQEFTSKVSDNCVAGIAFDLWRNVAYCADDERVGDQIDLSTHGPYFFMSEPRFEGEVSEDCTAGIAFDLGQKIAYCADDERVGDQIDLSTYGPYFFTIE